MATLGLQSIKERLSTIIKGATADISEYDYLDHGLDADAIAQAIMEQLPIKMVECAHCGNQDIVTERQCYKCNRFWTED